MSPCPIRLLYIVVVFFFFPLPIAAQCNLATIYGLKTADCVNLDLTSVPLTIDSDLKTLNFHGNRLTYLDIDTFASFSSLQNLYLVRNHLETIAADAFLQLQNLQILDLEGNRLNTIPGPAFAFIPSLRFLSLRSNPISYVTNSDLIFLKNLEVLNLENCWLKRIEPRAFAQLARLYELNLVNNELQGLNAEMGDTLASSLAILRLHSNPWQCDCRLRWLRLLVTRVPNWDFGVNTPTCAGPELLRGVTWKQFVPDQFACPSTIVMGNATTIRELSVGANATIECVASGDPQPTVTWMKGSRFVADDLVSQSTLFTGSRSDSKVVRSVVTLRDVSEGDANDYKCIAVNTAGRSEVTYKVVVARNGGDVAIGGGSGKHQPEVGAGTLLSSEMMLGVAVAGTGFVCGLLMCVTCAVMRGRAKASCGDRKLLDPRPKTVPVDDVGHSPAEEDSFSSSGSDCPSSPCGVRDPTAAEVDENRSTAATAWIPRRESNHQGNNSRISPVDHLPPTKPAVISSPIVSDQADTIQEDVRLPPVIPPLDTEQKRVVPSVKEAPEDSVTPDLLSDRHVINHRNDRVVDAEPSSRMDGAGFCSGSRTSALEDNGRVRVDDRAAVVNSLNAKPFRGEPRNERPQSVRGQRAAPVEMKSFCDNPVCHRERLSNSPSPASGAPPEREGDGGRGERLFPVMGSICSHRLALRKNVSQPSAASRSPAPGRPSTARPPRGSQRRDRTEPRRADGVLPPRLNRPSTSESCRDRHRRSNGAINHQSYTLSRNPGASRVWASQQECLDNGHIGTTREGRIPGGHSSSRTPVFYLRASSSRLDRDDDLEDPFPVTLNRRQTFSSMSLNEILSPPFGLRANRRSGAFEAQGTRTAGRKELGQLRGTAV